MHGPITWKGYQVVSGTPLANLSISRAVRGVSGMVSPAWATFMMVNPTFHTSK